LPVHCETGTLSSAKSVATTLEKAIEWSICKRRSPSRMRCTHYVRFRSVKSGGKVVLTSVICESEALRMSTSPKALRRGESGGGRRERSRLNSPTRQLHPKRVLFSEGPRHLRNLEKRKPSLTHKKSMCQLYMEGGTLRLSMDEKYESGQNIGNFPGLTKTEGRVSRGKYEMI